MIRSGVNLSIWLKLFLPVANKIIITFDVEEFDLPVEFGSVISFDEQIAISKDGLDALLPLLSRYGVRATFFTTATYAVADSSSIRTLAQTHEIGSHACCHSTFLKNDYLASKEMIENISGSVVSGFRMPRLLSVDFPELKKSGYLYDSSINPTFLPGRYNKLSAPRTLHREPASGLFELPASVTPICRIPLFWLAFKNLPLFVYYRLCRRTLRHDGYLHLYFHAWEFADISRFAVPRYIKKPSGKVLLEKMERLLMLLSDEGEYIPIVDFIMSQAMPKEGGNAGKSIRLMQLQGYL